MTIRHESVHKGYRNHMTQCYAIMTTDGHYCQDCLKWTNENVKNLEIYSRYV